jgi:hypothetical protein
MKLINMADINIINNQKPKIVKGIYIFLFNLVFISMSYGILTITHYAIDTYSCYFTTTAAQHLQLGRIFSYLIARTLDMMHINPARSQAPFTIFLFTMMALCSVLLVKKVCDTLKTLTLLRIITVNLAVLLSFVNIFILEWYLNPESTVTAGFNLITLTIAVLAVCNKTSVKNLLISLLFLFISINIYQINITLFVILSLTIILLKNDLTLNKTSVMQSIWIFILGLAASVTNILALKILQVTGLAALNSRNIDISIHSLVDHFMILFGSNQQRSIWALGSGFMPSRAMLIFLIVGFIYLFMSIIKKRLSASKILFTVLIIAINYFIIFVPHMLTQSLWLAPRTMVGIFTFLTSIFLIIIKLDVHFKFPKIIPICIGLFLFLNFYQIQAIAMNHFAVNKIDKEYIMMINDKINEYEEKNGIAVTQIAMDKDASVTYGYFGNVQYISYDTNIRAFDASWSDVTSINCITGRNLKKIDMDDEIYNKYFKDKDWKYFNPDEQMIFVGDTLYMMIY